MDKRYLLFLFIAATIWLGWIKVMQVKFPPKKPDQKLQVAAGKEEQKAAKDETKAEGEEKSAPEVKAAEDDQAVEAEPVEKPVASEPPLRDDLFLGQPTEVGEKGQPEYYMYVQFSNRDAAVTSLKLNSFLDETRKHRFQLLGLQGPGSFRITKIYRKDNREERKSEATGFDHRNWEVVSNTPGELVFRNTAFDGKLEVLKAFTLEKNSPIVNLKLSFRTLGEEPLGDVVYEMTGGSGLPTEGKWYTRITQQVVAALVPTNGSYPYLEQQTADQIAKGSTVEYSQTPLQFAGISNQYFASLVIQEPKPTDKRLIASAAPIDFQEGNLIVENQFHNIGVRLTSTPLTVRPDEPVEHQYLLYNGPKDTDLLAQYQEYQLPLVVHYPNFMFLPIGTIARLMVAILEFFHSIVADYGVAIILLTVLVRSCMFPLSYKQSTSMLKMQALQPQMQEIKEKYGNDKERLNREMMELYRKANVNPVSGCLPMFIQLPIFVGLWQALSNSFNLRQSSFLYGLTWIHDLAAPDQLFKFPAELPWLGPYFNLLPVLAVIQMVLQARFLSPPATSPEMEMQKKMMTIMMVFFGFFFYNVPAGLVVYIITSGAWSLAERTLLPKPKQTTASRPLVSSPAKDKTDMPGWKANMLAKRKRKSRR